MGTTSKYGLYVTSAEDNPNFIDWRTALCGDSDSNMTKIDAALGDKLDAPAEDGTAGQILTKTASGAEWAEAPKSIKNLVDATATGSVRMASVPDANVTGQYAFAEGDSTKAKNYASHAEGGNTTASGVFSHAEGGGTRASAQSSHAEGGSTTASGNYSHAEGNGTKTYNRSQHVQGEYNIETDAAASSTERGIYAHIVGNGTFSARSNAHTLDWDGNAWFAGDVYVGSTSGTNKDDGSVKLMKEPATATDGQVLTYNGTEWEAADASGGESEVFIATYDTTTYAEILEAYNAGKAIFCKRDNDMASLVGKASSDSPETAFYFGAIDGFISYLYKCVDFGTSTEWSVSETTLMKAADASGEESNVFIATYGTTTYDELNTAYTAGKMLFCKNSSSNKIASFASFTTGTFNFGVVDYNDAFITYACIQGASSGDSRWINSTSTLANKSDIPSLTSYVTYSALKQYLNRDDSVDSSNTNYTNYQARGEALVASSTTPSAYGTIAWQYS